MVKCHAVVREYGEREHHSHDPFAEDVASGPHFGILPPASLGGLAASPVLESSVRLRAEIDSRSLDSVGRFQERRLLGNVRVIGEKDTGLHIGMGLLQEEIPQDDAAQEKAGAN